MKIAIIFLSNLLFTTFFVIASLLSIYFNANLFATLGGFLPQSNLIDITFIKEIYLLSFILPTEEVIKDGQIFHYMSSSQISVLFVGLLFDLVKSFSSMLKNAQIAKGDLDSSNGWRKKGVVLFVISVFATTGSFYFASADSNNKKLILSDTIEKIKTLKETLAEDKINMQDNIKKGIVTATEQSSGARLDKDKEELAKLEDKRDSLLIHNSNPVSNPWIAALIGLCIAFVLEWVIKLSLGSLTFTKAQVTSAELEVKKTTDEPAKIESKQVHLLTQSQAQEPEKIECEKSALEPDSTLKKCTSADEKCTHNRPKTATLSLVKSAPLEAKKEKPKRTYSKQVEVTKKRTWSREKIITALLSGELKPSARFISASCGVSQDTARAILHELVAEFKMEQLSTGTFKLIITDENKTETQSSNTNIDEDVQDNIIELTFTKAE